MKRRWLVSGYALLLSAAITAPLFAPGYLLLRDAVSTPRSYLTDAALGLGESAPRAVPQDAAIAVLSAAVDGGLVVKALLLAGLVAAGRGAARLAALLLPDSGVPGQCVAATLAIWNPYVAERLLQGHWSLLLGYGCLPWVAAAVAGLRQRPDPSGWSALVFWVALAGFTPTGLLLAAAVGLSAAALPGTGARRWRCGAAVLATAALAALPWLTASALSGALRMSQTEGLAPFAARAEPGLGTLASLAGLGGIWNAEAVPASRTGVFAVVGTVVLLAVVACGLPVLLRRRTADPLVILAGVGVLVPAALATGPGLAALRAAVAAAPGLAVLRDGQKWVALAMPAYALAGAAAVLALRRWGRPALTAAVCCLALIAVLPDLAWGVGGRMTAVRYPPGWGRVAAAVNADPATVAVLPAETMRRFAWAGPAPVLDPLARWLRAEVPGTGDLRIGGHTVPGEGAGARVRDRLLLDGATPADLTRAGVGWVVVEKGTPGGLGAAPRTLAALPALYSDTDIALYRVGGTSAGATRPRRAAVSAAHLVWAAMVLGGGVLLAALSVRRGRAGGGTPRG